MTSREGIVSFLSQKTIAVVGVSANRSKYGNIAFRSLKARGYTVFAVNPNARTVEGSPCYPDLKSLPAPADAVLLVVPPIRTEVVVQEAVELGIRHFWMQPGAESEEAIRRGEAAGANVVHGVCVLIE
jgi:uncharacterized protein